MLSPTLNPEGRLHSFMVCMRTCAEYDGSYNINKANSKKFRELNNSEIPLSTSKKIEIPLPCPPL